VVSANFKFEVPHGWNFCFCLEHWQDYIIWSWICALQIENEYGGDEQAYGACGKAYAMWAASMALAQNTGVPWTMCQQSDAPDPVVSFWTSVPYVLCYS
jgi:hypothetical protein